MKIVKYLPFSIVYVLFTATLGACGSAPVKNAAPRISSAPTSQAATAEPEFQMSTASTAQAYECGLEQVYFAFDSSDLNRSSRDTLSRNARCLKEKRSASVTVTGMADPRGTEEYNLALGQKRSSAVGRGLA